MHSASHSHSVHVHVHVFISSTYTCITVAVSQCPWLCDAALPTALVCMLLCFFHACCSKLHSPSSRCTLYMCTPPGNTSLYPSCLNISRTTARKGHSTCTCQLLFCFLHCLLCYMCVYTCTVSLTLQSTHAISDGHPLLSHGRESTLFMLA